MIIRLIIFLAISFAALGIGSLFTGPAVTSDWYLGLNKAPWTPPGWVFGATWTTIMVCFALYMTWAWPAVGNTTKLGVLFGIQWILNVLWNPVFFYWHQKLLGLIIISALTLLLVYLLITYWPLLKLKSLLLLPYVIWLAIATSLNAYILIKN